MRKVLLLLFLIWVFCPSYLKAENYYTYVDLKDIFIKQIQKELYWIKGKIVLQQFRIEPKGIKIPKEAVYKIKFFSSPHIGSNFIVLAFYRDNIKIATVRLWGYVDAKVPVVVTVRPISSREIIKKQDIALRYKLLSRLPQDAITDIVEVIGKQTRISLNPGTVLRRAYIDSPVLVKIDQEVEIIARGRYFVVKAKGRALQNGRKGDIIRVRNLSSKRIIWAKVIAPQKVEVSF